MQLTQLELFLLGALLSLLTGLFVRLVMGNVYVKKSECRQVRDQTSSALQEIKNGQDIQFRMLRGIIVSLPIGEKEKRELLNERGTY